MDIQNGGSQKDESKYPIIMLMCRKQKNVINDVICKAEIETQRTNNRCKDTKEGGGSGGMNGEVRIDI